MHHSDANHDFSLTDTNIGDQGAVHLGDSLKHCHRLRELDLYRESVMLDMSCNN